MAVCGGMPGLGLVVAEGWLLGQDDLVRTLRRPSWKDSFPPKELVLAGDNAKVAEWLAAHVPAMLPPDATCTERERQLARLSAGEYIAMRKAGEVSCEEYAVALTKRWSHYSCAAPVAPLLRNAARR